ncbi:DoxX family protein [Thalassospira marina]|uniref:DoxX family protein n=1 Tax=Thalassospira marina TaxID=2048283 RepID=A0A2N3KMW2_9PROT|nr:DoxX family protein [Thalassospira marina]AUG54514.1 DoxX family protein [Thalassospira marina]PKR51892.1 DoxX family protein [Thalassospira marina]
MSNSLSQSGARPIIPALGNLWAVLEPLSWLILRVTTGILMMPHGAGKLFGMFGGYGLEGTGGYFDSIGIHPGYLFALLVGLLEFFGGAMLVLGLLTRPVAAAVVVFMTVAFFIHLPNGYAWINAGVEMPIMWGMLALSVLIRGGGRFSLDRKLGVEF